MPSLIVLFAFILIHTSCLNFQLQGDKEFCMRFQGGNIYSLQYVVSGNQDQEVLCTITQNEKIILTKEDVSEFQFLYDYISQDPIKVCFSSTDGQQKEISFDFYHFNDPVRKIIDKKDLYLVQSALIQAYQQMESISRNQQYQIERDEMHKISLQDSQSKIKWAGIVKIIFLLGSALIQLWIMKGFFTGNNPYQPVQSV